MSLTVACRSRSAFFRRVWLLRIAGLTLALSGCGRQRLPEPTLPLVTTEDAPFRAQPPVVGAKLRVLEQFPEIQTARFDNGLSLWVVSRPRLPYVAMLLVARDAGTLDSPVPAELMRFTTRAVVEGGTVWLDGRTVEPPVINGRQVGFMVGPTQSQLRLQVVKSALENGLTILTRTLRAPAFGKGNLDEVRLAELKDIQYRSADATNILLELTLTAALGKPISDQLLSSRMDEVRRPAVEAVKRCYQERFQAESLALIAVGDVTLPELTALVEPELSTWQSRATAKTRQPPTPVRHLSSGRSIHFVPQAETGQATVLVLQPAPASGAPSDELAFALLAEIAIGAVRSRSNNSLRHDAGITYGVRPRLWNGPSFGLLAIEASFEQDETARAIGELVTTLARLQESMVSDDELKHAKLAFFSQLERQLGDNSSLAQLLAQTFADQRSPDFLSALPAALAAVTPQDLLRVARNYLRPNDLEIGVLGPPSLGQELDDLGALAIYSVGRASE